jgi:hypothetical protein
MKNVIQMVNFGGQWVAVKAKKASTAIAVGGTALMSSGATFAADYTTQITAAQTEGTGNVSAVIGAVIAIAI